MRAVKLHKKIQIANEIINRKCENKYSDSYQHSCYDNRFLFTYNSRMDYKSHFKNLEEDFYAKIIQENRRKKQEDVKMRVLGDPRITYEQYSEMLQGAHLKPIKKGDHADISQGYKRKVTLTDCKNEEPRYA